MSPETLETRDPSELKRHDANQEIYGDENLEIDFVESIRKYGVQEPVVITDDDIIISGHRRVQAAKDVGEDEIPVLVKSFDSPLEEKEAIVHYNKQRRKTFSQKMREAEVLQTIYEDQGRERQGTRTDLLQTFAESEFGSTRDKLADQLDWSHEKYRQAKKVWDASKEVDAFAREVERINAGEQSIHGAYRKLQDWEALHDLQDAVGWDTAKNAGVLDSIQHREETFKSSKTKVNKDDEWHKSLRVLREDHEREWGRPSQGDAFVYAYLLEEEGLVDYSQERSTDPESLTEKKPDKDILRELYWDEELSLLEIAIKYGVDEALVEYWMYEEEVPLRRHEFSEPDQNRIERAT